MKMMLKEKTADQIVHYIAILLVVLVVPQVDLQAQAGNENRL